MAGSVNVGSADVTIVPDAQGFSAKLSAQITPEAKALGESLGKLIGDTIQQRIKDGITGGLGPTPQTKTQGSRQGNDFGGAFSDAVQTRIRAALKSLPSVQIGVATSEADQKIKDLQAELLSLSKQTIGVDISDEDALAKVRELQTRLEELGHDSPNVQVRVDSLAAAAKLAEIEAAVAALSGERADIEVNADTGGASANLASLGGEAESAAGGFSGLIAAGLALAPALIPVIAAVTGALAGLVGLLGAVAVGGGVLALGFHGIAAGVQALDKSQTAAAGSGRSAANSAIQVANASRQVEAAERSLANTRANAADAATRSSEQVKNAKQSEKDTVVEAARNTLAAEEAQAAAEQHLADVREQSAQQVQQAQDELVQASRNLADAQKAETDAQNALTDARKTAQQQLEDLANQVVDGQNAQRDATFAVTDAQAALTAAQSSDPTNSQEATQKAQLAYDEAVQRLNELTLQNKRLADQKAAADAAGVEGSQVVTQAQDRLAQATQSVTDAQTAQAKASQNVVTVQLAALSNVQQAQDALIKASQNVVTVQVDGAEKVAKAQQAVTDALRDQVSQTRQSAQSIAQALDAVASAQSALSSAGSSGGGGGGGLAQQANAFDKLSPAAKAFALFIHDQLLPAFSGIQAAAAKGLLPGVEEALKLLLPVLPGVATFVGKVATALGDLFLQGARALKDPFWRGFFDYAEKSIIPTLKGLAQFVGDVITGFAGLIQAFAPITGTIGDGMLGLADSFAAFGEQAGKPGSPFQSFLGYVEKYAPLVGQFFLDLFGALGNIVQVAAPFGAVVLGLIDEVLKLVRELGPTGLAKVLLAVGAVMVYVAGPVTALIAGAALLAIGFDYLYTHSKTVHDFVNDHILPVFHALSDYFSDVVLPILKKVGGEAMEGIRAGLQVVGEAIDKHKPQLDEIGTAFESIVDIIVKKVVPVLGPVLKIAFEGVGDFAAGLIDIIAGIVTAFDNLPAAASTAWDKIKDYFADGVGAVVDVINVFIRALDKIPGVTISQLGKISSSSGSAGTSTTSGKGTGNSHGGVSYNANGGVLPGYAPGVDSVVAMLSPGEGVLVPEAVRMLGPSWVYAVNAYAARGRGGNRTPGHFSIGGIIGDVGHGISSVAGTIGGILGAPERAAVNAAISTAKHYANETIPAGFFRDVADSSLDKIGDSLKFADGGIVGDAWSPLLASVGGSYGAVDVDGTASGYQDHRKLEVNNYHRAMTPSDIAQGWSQHDAIHARPLMAGAGLGMG
jgi:hypothetical protein